MTVDPRVRTRRPKIVVQVREATDADPAAFEAAIDLLARIVLDHAAEQAKTAEVPR